VRVLFFLPPGGGGKGIVTKLISWVLAAGLGGGGGTYLVS